MEKIAAITMVKDEGDILELFVRINCRHLDHIFILDHASSDNSLKILMLLKAEGLPITLYRDESQDFQQSVMLTNLIRIVAATNEYDYIVILDGDEFIYTKDHDFAAIVSLQMMKNKIGLLPWVTYVPSNGNYFESSAPLWNVFRQRKDEGFQFYKVIIPNEVAKNCVIGEGNHAVLYNEKLLDGILIDALLQHVPVRSIEQITAKALIGSHQLSIKKNRGKYEGIHWDQMSLKIKSSKYKISRLEFLSMALFYAGDINQDFDEDKIDFNCPLIGNNEDVIVYKNLIEINLIEKLDLYNHQLCSLIRNLKEI